MSHKHIGQHVSGRGFRVVSNPESESVTIEVTQDGETIDSISIPVTVGHSFIEEFQCVLEDTESELSESD